MKSSLVFFSVALMLSIGLDLVVYDSEAHGQSFDVQPNYYQAAAPLKPGDRLLLTVVGFPDLSGEQMVMADGTFLVPLVGAIRVGGLTPAQAASTITEALRPYVRRPQVGLSMLSQSPIRISVTGAVLEPGPRLIPPADDDNAPTTLSGVLGLAGGITPNANLRNIIVRRGTFVETVPGTALTSRKPEIEVDLWQVIQSGNLAADIRIYDGDEVIVPTAQVSSADQQLLLTSTVAPTTITVQVAGAVNNPGSVEVDPQANVSSAVASAGGLSEEARSDSIALFRMSPEGQLQQRIFNFGEDSEPVLEGDLIVVDRSTRSNVSDIFQFLRTILNPIDSLVNIFNPDNGN